MKTIYVIHPFGGDPENTKEIGELCRDLINMGYMPISSVHCYSYLDDHNQGERAIAMEFCEELISLCDEAVVCGDWVNSDGCREDLAVAIQLNKPVKTFSFCREDLDDLIPAKEVAGEEDEP